MLNFKEAERSDDEHLGFACWARPMRCVADLEADEYMNQIVREGLGKWQMDLPSGGGYH